MADPLLSRVRRLFGAQPAAPVAPAPTRPQLTSPLALADTRSGIATQFPATRWNPDTLVSRKGLRVYDEMRVDEQVFACLELKTAAVIGPGWQLSPDDEEDPAQVDLADQLTADLRELPESFDDVLAEVLSALAYGFSVTELVWALGEPEGPSGTAAMRPTTGARLRLAKLAPIAPHDVEFEQNGYGEILGLRQRMGAALVLPPAKFLHFVAHSEFGNPYGRSELRSAYRSFWHKQNWVQWLAIYGEKLADAPLFATYKPGTGPDQVAEMRAVLENLQARTVMVGPEGTTVGTISDTRDPRATFLEAIEHFNLAIAKALLIPDKIGLVGGAVAGGSYSLGQSQQDAFLFVLGLLQRRVASAVQQQVIRPMAAFAAPKVPPPTFALLPIAEDNREAVVTAFTAAVTSAKMPVLLKDLNHVRSLLGFPELSQQEYDQAKEEAAEAAAALLPPAPGMPPAPGSRDDPTATDEEKVAASRVTLAVPGRALSRAEARADVMRLAQVFDQGTGPLGVALAEGAAALVADVKAKAKRMLPSLTPEGVRDLAVKSTALSAVRQDVERELAGGYARGVESAAEEVAKLPGPGSAGTSVKFVAGRMQAAVLEALLPDDQWNARAQLSEDDGLHAASRPGLIGTAARRFFRAKSFWITGLLGDDVVKAAQAVLFNALKGDKLPRHVEAELDDVLGAFLPSTDAAGRVVNVPARIETIARTNMAEAVNEGRYALFTDPDLEDVLPGLEYSAVLDDRVRSSHAAWDNVVKPASFWLGPPDRRPPAGFNCRCVLLPVSLADDQPMTPDESLPTVPFPDEGFR